MNRPSSQADPTSDATVPAPSSGWVELEMFPGIELRWPYVAEVQVEPTP